ncbi:MAG: NAD(P)H-dependent glycerol-3-phosphate dehydrogenase [Desulfobacteraceae bacterium]|nr:MAG: NAD(P)H-dependent glycerol-3-phosphate dehydrogenase [Desulfobacteraceae bacterium]
MLTEIGKIAVIGAGSWGTALANLLAGKGLAVDLWVREPDVYQQIKQNRENKIFLPEVLLSPNLNPVQSFEQALIDKEVVVMVVPSHVFREILQQMKPHLAPRTLILSATKGIENETLLTMQQVLAAVLDKTHTPQYACLAGPSFAKEVSLKLPTAVTIACQNLEAGAYLQRLFFTEFFRVYTSQDIIGIELCGALKNVIALGAGIADGLGSGYNARAALITRGLAEITRLGLALGANSKTFAGLAGMGDLVLTCTSDLSRNRTVGIQLGKGKSLTEITKDMKMVAEGVKTTQSAYDLAQKIGVDMPIIAQVYAILYKGKEPKQAVKELMTRELKVEIKH